MNYAEPIERKYQNQIVELFKRSLSYSYLGNFQYELGQTINNNNKENSPFIENECLVFLKSQLTKDGAQCYTEMQLNEVIHQVKSALLLPDNHSGSLIDANSKLYDMMIHGVKAKPSQNENERDVMLFDFANPQANRFAIAEEVSYTDKLTGSNSRPDLVVYVNGFAIAVIELKRSIVSIDEGIRQQLSNQCDLIPSFFTTTQFAVVANESNGFRYATIYTPKDFWCPYKQDTNQTGVSLTDREAFTAFFEKSHLIDFFRYGVLTDGGIKKVMRPHQFHALRAAMPRLREKSSGVIWHSQGSGKSLTMIWLAAYIRANFKNPRVVVLTDRKELDKQIAVNFTNSGDFVECQNSGDELLESLNSGEQWLICSLIHKFGRHKANDENTETGNTQIPLDKYLQELKQIIAEKYHNSFKVKGNNIFIFVDECHRTQGGRLHEAMKEIMGQDVMFIGFTGTPLLSDDKKIKKYSEAKDLSEIKFGPYIHKYLHKQAVEDKVILDLQYEGRNVDQQISNKQKLDEKKEEITRGLDETRCRIIEDRWATLERIYSSQYRIERIGYSILDDMAKYPLNTSWCNAMLVAGNIESALKYYDFFQNHSSDTTLKNRCAVVTSYDPNDADLRRGTNDPNRVELQRFKHDMTKQVFGNAGKRNADEYEAWAKEEFIKNPGRMKLIIVVDKLLTGFDAPNATYLYIDKEMRNHNLFQSICRVNRLGKDVKDDNGTIILNHKEWGKIVDFKHLFKEISDAVTNFNDEGGGLGGLDKEDIEGLLNDHIEKGKRKLLAAAEAYDALKASWNEMSRDELLDYLIAIDMSKSQKEREEESVLKQGKRQSLYKIASALVVAYDNLADYMGKAGFTSAESEVFHKKAIEANTLHLLVLQKSGDYFDPHEKDAAMRALLDRFIKAEDAEVVIPATSDFSFLDLIDNNTNAVNASAEAEKQANGSKKAAAEIIEGKARAVINSYKDKDPHNYTTFSERLQKLLDEMRKNSTDYGEKMCGLIELIKEAKSGGVKYPDGVSTPFKKALYNNRAKWCSNETSDEKIADMISKIDDIVEYDAQDGWENPSSPKSDDLKQKLQTTLEYAEEQKVSYVYTLAVQNRR